ncbi:unnamed protein product [Strongylus vulgaris]|uniref:Uncharacterized protein n=1 Tax=Strongylus vulgaris TaxID=40348 RepID=A0A3P7ISP7_STRVU|nr:unnamed protein product [Strongylus vulgaris]
MAWDMLPISALSHLELEDDIESVSRRGSFCLDLNKVEYITWPQKFHPKLSFQDLRSHFMDRRSSYASLLSTGYGSVWSLTNSHS